MSCGRLFQSVGQAAANARSPIVRRVRGTSSCSEDADRRRRRDGISTKRWRSSGKYGGARPCSDRNTSSLACTGCAQKNAASEDWPVCQWYGQSAASQWSILLQRSSPTADNGAGTPGCRSAWCCRSQPGSIPMRRQATGRLVDLVI